MKKLSIVVPVYYNEENLPETVPTLVNLQILLSNYKFELIFVDDGSKDNSLKILLDFQRKYPTIIKVIKLSRNFGSMMAVQAGLSHAEGDCIAIISADLQDPPELILKMVKFWEKGIKVVYAVRKKREDSIITNIFSNLYYKLLRKFALPDYPTGGFDFLLIDKQLAKRIQGINEKNTNLMSLVFWMGYENVMIPYERKKRKKGKSRWTISKKIKLFIDSFVSFSYFPIRVLSAFGIIYAFASFTYGGVIFISWLIQGTQVQGWIPTMLVLTFTAGIQMSMLGVLGEYLWRTFDESRNRPPYIIDEVYDGERKDDIL